MFLAMRITAALCLLMITLGAQAQSRRTISSPSFITDQLDITLEGVRGCPGVNNVLVVMSNDENHPFPAAQDARDHCHWIATRRTGTFDTGLEHFSLRLGIARTTCKRAKGDEDKGVARVAFLVYRMEVRQVNISTSLEIPISYVRGVPAHFADSPSIPCTERAPFIGQPIPDVWFSRSALHPDALGRPLNRYAPNLPAELLRLQLGKEKPDPAFPGVIVNDEAFTRYMKGDEGSLGVQEIVAAIGEERAKAKQGLLPLFSSNAYSGDRAELDKLATDKIVLKVSLTVK